MISETLTTLQYSTGTKGPWRLYRYNRSGIHSGGQWFNREIRYPDEEILIADAKRLTIVHQAAGLEVRITDGGDQLVYHSIDGKVVYGDDFWKAILP